MVLTHGRRDCSANCPHVKRNSRVVEVGGERPELRLRLEVLDDSEVREVALERHDEDESARSAARSRVRSNTSKRTDGVERGGTPYLLPSGGLATGRLSPTYLLQNPGCHPTLPPGCPKSCQILCRVAA